MSRIVAAMCVVLAVAAATSGAATAENPVRSSYIVVLNPDAARSAAEAGSQRPLVSLLAGEIARAHDGGLEQVFQYALKGFAVELTEKQAARLAEDPRVDYVEPDQVDPGGRDPEPRDLGARPDRPARPAAEQFLHLQPDRSGRPRLRDRHRAARVTPGVHRPGQQRLHRDQRRSRHDRLQRPRHPRRRHDRRHDLRRRQAGDDPRRARPRLHRLRLDHRRDRRRRLGDPEPRQARGREHEPGRRRLDGARPGDLELDRGRRQLRDRGRQRQRQRLQRLARPRRRGEHGRLDHEHRRTLVVLELRHLRRPLRARLEHHLGLVHVEHGDEHDQRHVDGDAARGRGARALPADEPVRVAGDGDAGAAREHDAEQGHEPGHGLAEPAARLALRRRAAAGRHDAADDVDHLPHEPGRPSAPLSPSRRTRATTSASAASSSSSTARSPAPTRPRPTRSPGTRRRRRTARIRCRPGRTTPPATSVRARPSASPSPTARAAASWSSTAASRGPSRPGRSREARSGRRAAITAPAPATASSAPATTRAAPSTRR